MTAQSRIKGLLSKFALAASLLLLPSTVSAAAPDGLGPWADSVVSFSQGLTKSGAAISAPRSDPASALGVAENDTTEPHFVSLGFGGTLTLGFDNGFKTAVIVMEATNPGYPTESANVEVSANGSTWLSAGSITQDGQVTVPSSLACAKYVRITDTSNAANFSDDTADAFDVDGVQVTGDACTPPTTDDCCCSTTSAIISGNGAGSTNTIVVTKAAVKTTSQTNNTAVVNVIGASAKTGNNKANKNTGGDTKVKSGKAKVLVGVAVGGGSNTAH